MVWFLAHLRGSRDGAVSTVRGDLEKKISGLKERAKPRMRYGANKNEVDKPFPRNWKMP